ncbi:hypothetical protein HNP65_000877 [Thermosipho japonicus]|uniref:Lipoprotein n=1 Tax=Thermosipho japonicus TaxID=90323 RepID=A0A841GRW1_9BACT|nr:hypothetical protein [Thermosipho japonicus]MBB6062439.1 hypothetical protein [Thermosipho japonicus]
MKRLVLIAIILIAISCFSDDKLLHINVSSILESFFSTFSDKSEVITFSIGIVKEVYDLLSKNGICDFYDILADIYGIMLYKVHKFKDYKFLIVFVFEF